MIPMGDGKAKKLPLRELFRCIWSKDVLKSNAKRYCTEGTVVGDFGNKIVVRLSSGKEVVEYRDEVIIYD